MPQNPVELDPLSFELFGIRTKTDIDVNKLVSVPDTYLGTSQSFHPEGLYSPSIFGQKGSKERMASFGYIDLHTDILIPDVFIQLKKARELYADIMQGVAYVKFDPKLKDFVETSIEEGGLTGYSYFLIHLDQLEPQESGSSSRSRLINFLKRNRGKLTTRYLVVIPAGFRDIEEAEDGRMTSDDINSLYLSVMRPSSFIQNNSSSFDSFRYQTQLAVNSVSEYINAILYGKNGMVNAKFAKRTVRQGTRNVLTSQSAELKHIDDMDVLNPMDSTVGLIQLMSMFQDKILYQIKQLLVEIMPGIGYDFIGINPKTFEPITLPFDNELYSLLLTTKGMEKLSKLLKVKDNRSKIIEHKGMWLGGIYETDSEIRLISNPSELSKEELANLHPLTLAQLVYFAIAFIEDDLYGVTTRAPVLGQGGTRQTKFVPYISEPYQSKYLEPAHIPLRRCPIFEYVKEAGVIKAKLKGVWNDSYTVTELSLAAHAADFDGDMMAAHPVTTIEAVEEVRESLQRTSTYLDANGRLLYSLGTVDVANNVLLTLTT